MKTVLWSLVLSSIFFTAIYFNLVGGHAPLDFYLSNIINVITFIFAALGFCTLCIIFAGDNLKEVKQDLLKTNLSQSNFMFCLNLASSISIMIGLIILGWFFNFFGYFVLFVATYLLRHAILEIQEGQK